MNKSLLLLLPALLLLACNAEDSTQQTAPASTAPDTTETEATAVSDPGSRSIPVEQLQQENGAILLNWKMLSDVTFEDEYNEEVQAYVPYPTFGDTLRAIEGREVVIKGYVIPLEETGDETILVLSAQPYSSCFFCGGAGPESVMDIKLSNPGERKFTTDEQLRFRGRLRLNDSDLYYLNYILDGAELVN